MLRPILLLIVPAVEQVLFWYVAFAYAKKMSDWQVIEKIRGELRKYKENTQCDDSVDGVFNVFKFVRENDKALFEEYKPFFRCEVKKTFIDKHINNGKGKKEAA